MTARVDPEQLGARPRSSLGRYLLRAMVGIAAIVALLSPFTLPLFPFLILTIALTFPRFNRRFFTGLLAPFELVPDGRAETRLVAAFLSAVAVSAAVWGIVVMAIPQGDRTNGHWLLIPLAGSAALIAFTYAAVRR